MSAPHREAEASGAREELLALAKETLSRQRALEAYRGTPYRDYDAVVADEMWSAVHRAREALSHKCSPEQIIALLTALPAPTPPEADRALREALRTVRDDFDHDEDAHRYGTTCRVCLAVVALNEVGRFREPWDDRARAALAPRPTPEDRTDG